MVHVVVSGHNKIKDKETCLPIKDIDEERDDKDKTRFQDFAMM